MSVKYCIFRPLNLHKVRHLALFFFFFMYFVSFGVLAFSRSLSEKLRF
jgi:hypothetical protein